MTSTEDYYYRVFLPNEEKKRKEKRSVRKVEKKRRKFY